MEYCSPLTNDCPEVLTFLHAKHTKACPDYLSSVEFRNTLGRCLTRAQANHSKTFVYINELCTVLRQHATKKRQVLTKLEPGPSTSTSSSFQSTSVTLKSKDKTRGKTDEDQQGMQPDSEQPSTSGMQEDNKEEAALAEKKAKRASRKQVNENKLLPVKLQKSVWRETFMSVLIVSQIAYLENLLKVYNDEISRLQQAELSLDDLGAQDSSYIQEHKLKRKVGLEFAAVDTVAVED